MFRTRSWTARRWQVREIDRAPSTQDLLATWFEEEPPSPGASTSDFRAISAAVQTAGRGRRGHEWVSPEGGLWVSLGWTRPGPPDALVGLLVADTARRVVRTALGGAPGVEAIRTKWPNDLVIDPAGGNGRLLKWGGVVVEVQAAGVSSTTYRVGLGLDLKCPTRDLDIDDPVTSIQEHFGRSPEPVEALRALLELLPARLQNLGTHRSELLRSLSTALLPLGERIRFVEQNESTVADAIELAEDGSLVIENTVGRRRLYAAEVERVRRSSAATRNIYPTESDRKDHR